MLSKFMSWCDSAYHVLTSDRKTLTFCNMVGLLVGYDDNVYYIDKQGQKQLEKN